MFLKKWAQIFPYWGMAWQQAPLMIDTNCVRLCVGRQLIYGRRWDSSLVLKVTGFRRSSNARWGVVCEIVGSTAKRPTTQPSRSLWNADRGTKTTLSFLRFSFGHWKKFDKNLWHPLFCCVPHLRGRRCKSLYRIETALNLPLKGYNKKSPMKILHFSFSPSMLQFLGNQGNIEVCSDLKLSTGS